MPRVGHLDGGKVAQRIDGRSAVFAHAAVHVTQAVAGTVDREPRLAGQLRHAVVKEARPLLAFACPVDAAVEGSGAVESGDIGVNAQAHAEALAGLAEHQIA